MIIEKKGETDVKNDYITTYTGKHFLPMHPDPEKIDIRDIAHALSMLCRGNGHVKIFYSVGQHCILCAREAAAEKLSGRMILACLLHDAGECYLSDVPSPFKQDMPSYRALEDHLLDLIYQKYLGSPLSEAEEKELKRIDHALLAWDLKTLLDEEQEHLPALLVQPDYRVRPFADVEREYLEIFYRYFSE